MLVSKEIRQNIPLNYVKIQEIQLYLRPTGSKLPLVEVLLYRSYVHHMLFLPIIFYTLQKKLRPSSKSRSFAFFSQVIGFTD